MVTSVIEQSHIPQWELLYCSDLYITMVHTTMTAVIKITNTTIITVLTPLVEWPGMEDNAQSM